MPGPQALASAAQMNVIEFHTWNARSRRITLPDRLVFDLDPGEGTGWPQVQEAAMLVRALLDELGLQCWLKTSGGKGLHLVVPITPKLDYDAVKLFSKAVVQHMAKTLPQRFVAKSGGSNRVGKIFIDYLRNGFGQTTAAAFSARARPAWASRCLWPGSSWRNFRAARNGPLPMQATTCLSARKTPGPGISASGRRLHAPSRHWGVEL